MLTEITTIPDFTFPIKQHPNLPGITRVGKYIYHEVIHNQKIAHVTVMVLHYSNVNGALTYFGQYMKDLKATPQITNNRFVDATGVIIDPTTFTGTYYRQFDFWINKTNAAVNLFKTITDQCAAIDISENFYDNLYL
jgi:hypothetical protein